MRVGELGRPSLFILSIVLGLVMSVAAGPTAMRADDSATPSPTPAIVPEPTATATPTPIPTARPTATLVPIVRVSPNREGRATRHHRKRKRTRSAAVATPTSTTTAIPRTRKVRKHHRRHRARPAPTPTVTPTRVPAVTLNAEDSVSPVQCSSKERHPARAPFLYPPYRRWTSIVSYFDHDLPDFARDGLVVVATGMEAAPDAVHSRSDFPAYWNRSIRQYVYYDGHNGYDYNLWYQPVYAAAAGNVIFSAYEYPDARDHGYGQMVMVQHRGGYVTLYGHFSKLIVRAGQRVHRGQELGISGNTGHSTGPHLHFTVFHNCTPTDPYGWSGTGPDPLAGYQGESSVYLWVRPPLIANPAPGWPGMDRLPAAAPTRVLVLRLPSTRAGTRAFTSSLRREATDVSVALRPYAASMEADMLQGTVTVRGDVPFSRLYAIPGVASISSSDTLEGQKDDVLAALARAALVKPHRALHLSRSAGWTGYLVQWLGRTLLVGRGKKGAEVDLRLSSGKGGSSVRTVRTDETGAYAIDLGPLSPAERTRLQRILERAGRSGRVLSAARPAAAPTRGRQTCAVPCAVASTGAPSRLFIAIPILLVLVLVLLAARWVSRRPRAEGAEPPQ